jgi:hypothetical protein
MERIAAQEAVRHDRIAEVIESTVVRGICEMEDEFDFSTDETVARGGRDPTRLSHRIGVGYPRNRWVRDTKTRCF